MNVFTQLNLKGGNEMIVFKDLQKVLNKDLHIVLLYNNDGFSYNAFSDKLPEFILNSEVIDN